MASILEMIQSNDLLKVFLILVGVYLFIIYISKNKSEKLENDYGYMPNYIEGVENVKESAPVAQPVAAADQAAAPSAVKSPQQQQIDNVVAGKNQVKAEDLLPKYDDANEFAKQNPVSNLLKEQNFLISGYHVGINTVMQSNKIPYHDLRSAPPIPKENVGPWAQSSYEQPAGAGRRGLEIL
uniref:Minor capsid protein P11 C-terminal conserved region domain-containing protein n=1 Tax=viral metagenome TaxID=1070528 RepID=A0A6C0H7T8_9ZZZZ